VKKEDTWTRTREGPKRDSLSTWTGRLSVLSDGLMVGCFMPGLRKLMQRGQVVEGSKAKEKKKLLLNNRRRVVPI